MEAQDEVGGVGRGQEVLKDTFNLMTQGAIGGFKQMSDMMGAKLCGGSN